MLAEDAAPTLFDKITSLCALAGFSPNITQTSNLVSSVLTLVEAGEGGTLLPSSLQHDRFSDLSFCPLIDPVGGIELVMTRSPNREGETHRSFLDFVRSKKHFIRSSLDPDGFDRAAFHRRFNAEIVRFSRDNLK